ACGHTPDHFTSSAGALPEESAMDRSPTRGTQISSSLASRERADARTCSDLKAIAAHASRSRSAWRARCGRHARVMLRSATVACLRWTLPHRRDTSTYSVDHAPAGDVLYSHGSLV